MLCTISLTQYNHARVWIDELPSPSIEPSPFVLAHRATASGLSTPRIAAIEWHRVLGPRSEYAMLGGSWEPMSGNALRVYLPVIEDGPHFDTPLTPVRDSISSCFPREFIAGVDEGLRQCSSLSAGKITLCCAAVAEMSSSQHSFELATRVLIELLQATPSPPASEVEVGRILRNLL